MIRRGRPRKVPVKKFRVDTYPDRCCVFVRERGSDVAVACFRHGSKGHQSTIATLMAIAHALTLEDRSIGINTV